MNGNGGTRETTPILLTTGATPIGITITGGVEGPPVGLPSVDLVNTTRGPIEITEMNFVLDEPRGANALTLSAAFEINLRAGRSMLTQDFCPVIGFAPVREAVLIEGTASTVMVTNATEVRWIFPRPLILAPNEGINGTVRLSPNVAFARDGTCHLSMVARGRRMPSGTVVPAKRAIPYASGWIFTMAGLPSPDHIYQNRFNGPLHVTGIICRSVGVLANFNAGTIAVQAPGGLANTAIRAFAPLRQTSLFSGRAAVDLAYDLDPGDAFSFAVGTPTIAGSGITGTMISIIGWREE